MQLEVERDTAIQMLVAVAQSPKGHEQARLSQLSDGELAAEMAEPATAGLLAKLTRKLLSSWVDGTGQPA